MTHAMRSVLLFSCTLLAIALLRAEASPQTPASRDEPLVGIWAAGEPGTEKAQVLQLQPDGRGLWVTRRFGDVRDDPVRWKRGDDWLAVAQHGQTHDAELRAERLVLTSRRPDREVVTLERTIDQRYLEMLPPAPESTAEAESAVGAWMYRKSGAELTAKLEPGDQLLLLVLDDRGIGGLMGADSTTAIGSLLRWTRDGEVIELSLQGDVGARRVREARFFDDRIELPGNGAQAFMLRRTEEEIPSHFSFNLTPAEPSPPRRDFNLGGAAYYGTGATEAILATRGKQIFQIGAESEAPAHVREKLKRFREVALPRWKGLKDTSVSVSVSPNGRSIIIDGFRDSDDKALVYFWRDWQNAQHVQEFERYFRGGGRLIGDRFLYFGVGEDWARTIWDLETDAWYEAPYDLDEFDVNDELRWVGISPKYEPTTVKTGRLTATKVEQDLEFELDAQAKDAAWLCDGAFFFLRMDEGDSRIYNANGEWKGTVDESWRLWTSDPIDDCLYFVTTSPRGSSAAPTSTVATLEISSHGLPHIQERQVVDYVPLKASPSLNYLLASGERQSGDDTIVRRTFLCEPDRPLPPLPRYGRYWITWDSTDEAP